MKTRLVGLAILLLVACAGCAPVPTSEPTHAAPPTAAPTLAPKATEAPPPTIAPTAAPTVAPTAAPAESGALTIKADKPAIATFQLVTLSVSPEDSSCEWEVEGVGTLSWNTGASVQFTAYQRGEATITARCDSGTTSITLKVGGGL